MKKMSIDDILEKDKENRGVKLNRLEAGSKLIVQTRNSVYNIEVLGNDQYVIQGGSRYTEPFTGWINGSTWGGSMLKKDWIGIDMYIEMQHPDPNKSYVRTSMVEHIQVIGPDHRWTYEL